MDAGFCPAHTPVKEGLGGIFCYFERRFHYFERRFRYFERPVVGTQLRGAGAIVAPNY